MRHKTEGAWILADYIRLRLVTPNFGERSRFLTAFNRTTERVPLGGVLVNDPSLAYHLCQVKTFMSASRGALQRV